MEHDILFGNFNREFSSGTNQRNVFHLPPNRKWKSAPCLLILSRLCRRPFSSPEPLGLMRALGTRMDGCRHECSHVRHPLPSSNSRRETPVTSSYILKVLGEMASARTSLAVSISLMVIARCISEETCKKRDTCSCRFNNGSIVNLLPKDGKTETLVAVVVICFHVPLPQ